MNELTNLFWNEHFRSKDRAELTKIKQAYKELKEAKDDLQKFLK